MERATLLGTPSSTHQQRKFSECCISYLTVLKSEEIQEAKPKYANCVVTLEEKCYGNKKKKSKAREMGGGEVRTHTSLG